jgi:hypothetical protein
MAANPEFAEFLVITLIQRLRLATALIRWLGLNDVSERVIDVLRAESRMVDGQLLLPRSLTQQEISQRVGATREMVNHVVRKLMKLGYLRRTGQRQVEVIRALPDSIRSLPNDQAWHNIWVGRCERLPPVERRVDVGYFTSGHRAVEMARKTYAQAVGCPAYCPECQVVVWVEAKPARRKAR